MPSAIPRSPCCAADPKTNFLGAGPVHHPKSAQKIATGARPRHGPNLDSGAGPGRDAEGAVVDLVGGRRAGTQRGGACSPCLVDRAKAGAQAGSGQCGLSRPGVRTGTSALAPRGPPNRPASNPQSDLQSDPQSAWGPRRSWACAAAIPPGRLGCTRARARPCPSQPSTRRSNPRRSNPRRPDPRCSNGAGTTIRPRRFAGIPARAKAEAQAAPRATPADRGQKTGFGAFPADACPIGTRPIAAGGEVARSATCASAAPDRGTPEGANSQASARDPRACRPRPGPRARPLRLASGAAPAAR